MVDRGDNTQEPFVKRVTLPSGKSIEVLYFPDHADAAAQAPQSQQASAVSERPLHVCIDCSSSLVYPTDWQEAGPEHWDVELRCPNCEWRGSGVFHQDVVESFDDELDRGIDVLLSDYRALVSSNMEDEIDRFARALDAGAILPVDF
ncbi:MAG TPA: hypothetical protein VH300_15925 [Thermoleophilaceae bacterium]|jgi:hypothetical protein|nr:hypothetical protein [Thermoleophilaceae bacterium]